jgi:hypothetical protein
MIKGQRLNRRRDGKGKLQMSTGDSYKGQFIRGLRQWCNEVKLLRAVAGSVLPKFTEYNGNYISDQKEGTATLIFMDGSIFHGYFKDNEKF